MLVEAWIKKIHDFDDDGLLQGFHDQWNRVGPLNFIVESAVPLIERIGTGWVEGEISISKEHFATECINSFLIRKWRQLNIEKNGWTVMMATLPGEVHSLGLLMSAVVASLSNAKVIYFGLDTPLEDLIATSNKFKPELLCLSISCNQKPLETEDCLFKLKDELNDKTKIISGGKGTPESFPGISKVEDFQKFNDWLNEFERQLKSRA